MSDDEKLQKYYDNLIEMFGTEGWKSFVSEVQSDMMALVQSAPNDCDNGDKWLERKGAILKANQIVNYENFIRQSMENSDEDSE